MDISSNIIYSLFSLVYRIAILSWSDLILSKNSDWLIGS